MLGLTTGTAAFFALGRMPGNADAIVILAGVVITVSVMEYPRRVHLVTGILLTFVAGALLWANLRTTIWQKAFGFPLAKELDSVAKGMFYRGWPLCPCMTCLVYFMKFHPSEPGIHAILAFDGIVCATILLVVRVVCEFCFQSRAKLTATMPHPPSDRPPAGSTSGPPVE